MAEWQMCQIEKIKIPLRTVFDLVVSIQVFASGQYEKVRRPTA